MPNDLDFGTRNGESLLESGLELKEWEDYHNHHRRHGALAGQTQYAQLLAKARAGASPAS